jgi:hypothetical protein
MTYKRNKNIEQSKSKESDPYDGPPKGDVDAFNKLHYIINTYLNSNSVKEWINSLRIPTELNDELKTSIGDEIYGLNLIRNSTADIFQTHLKTMTVELDTIISQFIVEDCYNTKEGENLLEFVNSNIRNN